jgi:hypothetical protein
MAPCLHWSGRILYPSQQLFVAFGRTRRLLPETSHSLQRAFSLKTARHRGISRIWLGLRVRKVATEAPFCHLSPRAFFGVSFLMRQPAAGGSSGVNLLHFLL